MFIASLLSGFSFNHGNTSFLYLKQGVSPYESTYKKCLREE